MPSDFVRDSSMTDASYTASNSPQAGLFRGTSVPQSWRLVKAEEVRKSKLLKSASADYGEFIWPQDERPSVPHNDFQGAEELPVLDLWELHQSGGTTSATEHPSTTTTTTTARDKIAKHLVKIFADWGFVQLVNHGVETQVIEEMHAQAKKFFDLPLEQKEKAKVSSGSSKHEGFGYGVESGFYYDGKPWVDRFQCRWRPVESVTEFADKVYCEDSDEAEKFRKSIEVYNKSLDRLTVQILELCAEGLGLESSTFTKPYMGTAGECTARLNYYPPCPQPSLTLGLGAHTDPNLLTILHQCKVGGLQIYRDGSWLSVKPSINSFIINVGDSFEAWTNGRFKSVRHRAVVNETEARLSIAYFSNPSPQSPMIVPQRLVDSQNPLQFRAAFTWLEYKSHLLEMHRKPNGTKTSKAWLRNTKYL